MSLNNTHIIATQGTHYHLVQKQHGNVLRFNWRWEEHYRDDVSINVTPDFKESPVLEAINAHIMRTGSTFNISKKITKFADRSGQLFESAWSVAPLHLALDCRSAHDILFLSLFNCALWFKWAMNLKDELERMWKKPIVVGGHSSRFFNERT
jgi:hypothetical protein